MKNLFFKYSLIFEAIIVIISIALFLIIPPSNVEDLFYRVSGFFFKQKPNHIPILFFAISPLFYFTISTVIALIWTKIIFSDNLSLTNENIDEEQARKQLRNINFWKFSFYANSLITICFSLFFFCSLPGDHKYYIWLYASGALIDWTTFIIPVLLASFSLGALFLSIGALWRTSRLASWINGIMALAIFMIPFLIASLFLDRGEYSETANNSDSSNIDTTTNRITVDTISYQEAQNIASHYLKDLWDNPEDDDENVSQAIRFGIEMLGALYPNSSIDNIRSSFQEEYSYRNELDNKNLWSTLHEENNDLKKYNAITKHVMRNGAALLNSFNSYKSLLYRAIPYQTYEHSSIKKMVDALTLAYQEASGNAGNNEPWNKIYDIMKDEGRIPTEFYDQISDFISEDVINTLKDKSGEVYNGDIVWVYSFWARRYHEGNSEQVYQILSEIQSYYGEGD